MTSQPLKGAALLSSTYGMKPEGEYWSVEYRKELEREAVARALHAKRPPLHDRKPVSPVFILGAVLVVLVFGILVVMFGWKPVVAGTVLALVSVVVLGMALYRPEEETDVSGGECPTVNRGDYPLDHKGR